MTVSKYKILHLMTKTCLIFGQDPALTSPKVAQYVLGTRETIEILKMYELRYLLLKVYPLIHNLFCSPRFNPKLKIKKNWKANFQLPEKALPRTENHVFSGPRVWPFEIKTKFSFKQRQAPPQILFASITPAFSKIIAEAAEICNMPWHENRWLNGSITAAISYPLDKLMWQYLHDSTQNKIVASFSNHWSQNKENEEKIKEKINYYGRSRWPSLLVIPDVFNNPMILDEAKKVGLPIIGLVNSNCPIEIEYPIFAQNQTSQSIHFFCQFLAILIAKETLFFQHKRYTMQKNKQKSAKTQKLTVQKNKILHKSLQQIKDVWKKPFFFKVVGGWQYRRSHRYLFGIRPGKSLESFDFSTHAKKYSFRHRKFVRYALSQNVYGKIKKWRKTCHPMMRKKKIAKSKKSGSLYFSMSERSVLKARHFIFAEKILKKFKMPFRRTVETNFKKKKPRFIVAANLFKKEYQKRYFQKNNLIPQEEKKLYSKFQNFLGFSNVIRQYTKYYKIPGTRMQLLGFPKPAQYFWWSLKQWFQNVKWRSPRALVKPTLGLNARQRHGILRYKHLFYRPGYKRDPKNPITAWQSWMNKNKKNLFHMTILKGQTRTL